MNFAAAVDEIDSLLQEARDLAAEHGMTATVSAIRFAQTLVQDETPPTAGAEHE